MPLSGLRCTLPITKSGMGGSPTAGTTENGRRTTWPITIIPVKTSPPFSSGATASLARTSQDLHGRPKPPVADIFGGMPHESVAASNDYRPPHHQLGERRTEQPHPEHQERRQRLALLCQLPRAHPVLLREARSEAGTDPLISAKSLEIHASRCFLTR